MHFKKQAVQEQKFISAQASLRRWSFGVYSINTAFYCLLFLQTGISDLNPITGSSALKINLIALQDNLVI